MTLFYAVIPPHWHHTREQLVAMHPVPYGAWFWYGYPAWHFTGQTAPDRRWDPRCLATDTRAPTEVCT